MRMFNAVNIGHMLQVLPKVPVVGIDSPIGLETHDPVAAHVSEIAPSEKQMRLP